MAGGGAAAARPLLWPAASRQHLKIVAAAADGDGDGDGEGEGVGARGAAADAATHTALAAAAASPSTRITTPRDPTPQAAGAVGAAGAADAVGGGDGSAPAGPPLARRQSLAALRPAGEPPKVEMTHLSPGLKKISLNPYPYLAHYLTPYLTPLPNPYLTPT